MLDYDVLIDRATSLYDVVWEKEPLVMPFADGAYVQGWMSQAHWGTVGSVLCWVPYNLDYEETYKVLRSVPWPAMPHENGHG